MRINTRNQDGIMILGLNGMLRGGFESQSLTHQVKQLIADQPEPRVVVELSEVSLIDSSGVGELIASFTSVKKCGGQLKVCGAQERVAEVLRIVKLHVIVDMYDSQAEALASFAD